MPDGATPLPETAEQRLRGCFDELISWLTAGSGRHAASEILKAANGMTDAIEALVQERIDEAMAEHSRYDPHITEDAIREMVVDERE